MQSFDEPLLLHIITYLEEYNKRKHIAINAPELRSICFQFQSCSILSSNECLWNARLLFRRSMRQIFNAKSVYYHYLIWNCFILKYWNMHTMLVRIINIIIIIIDALGYFRNGRKPIAIANVLFLYYFCIFHMWFETWMLDNNESTILSICRDIWMNERINNWNWYDHRHFRSKFDEW